MKLNKENLIVSLYRSFVENWNGRDAEKLASLFTQKGNFVGVDGAQLNGKHQIDSEMKKVFESSAHFKYVFVIKEVREISSSVYLLRSFASIVSATENKMMENQNVIQILVAKQRNNQFWISLFQCTPVPVLEKITTVGSA